MNHLNRRKFVSGSAWMLGTMGLPACGGSSESTTVAAAPTPSPAPAPSPSPAPAPAPAPAPSPAPAPAPAPAPSPAPAPAPAPGAVVTTLSLHATQAGSGPYVATVMPLQGQVPNGSTLLSPDDGSLRASVLSRWPDGSAAVMVAAGAATYASNEDRSIRLQLATPVGGEAALGASRIGQIVSSVVVDFGALGRVDLRDFSVPERIWWSNPQTVCARYRAGVSGHATLEAVIDIHAFASARALVEVVVENAKLAAASATLASKPAAASYVSATVSINGAAPVATVNDSGAPEGAHAAFRAWYASGWVGGSPGLRVTQLHTDLQKHPLLWKMARASTANLAIYASDAYVPWGFGRQRGANMGGTGDAASIGPLPLWEAQFLQSGDYRAANAVEANALSILGFNVNYRDTSTGLVPDATAVARKTQNGGTSNWPKQQPGGGSGAMEWEVAHQPAAGLMAFACRPSPVFIEIAQKICTWNATWSGEITNLSGWPGTWPDSDYSGVFGNPFQIRGRAWSLRSLAHATFLSPEGSAWKSGGKYWLDRNRLYLAAWTTSNKSLLNCMWDRAPNDLEDHQPVTNGFQSGVWQYHWLIVELHKASRAQLLTGTQQIALDALADWCALQPIRWVNEQTNGGWRYISYDTTIGRSGATVDSLPTWGAQRAWYITDAPASVAGPFFSSIDTEPTTYAAYVADNNPAYYPAQWWGAFVAAVERGVAGSTTAWATVQSSVTNLPAWLDGFGQDPRWGALPRN